MLLERVVSCLVCLLLGLGGAAAAHAKPYSLAGGGGQIAIGPGLPLPAQVFPVSATGAIFPPLLVPPNTAKVVQGTTAMTLQQRLSIPRSALFAAPTQRTVGLFAQNPTLYAVATNLGWAWPAAPAVLSTGARTGNKTTTFSASGGFIRYSNAAASKFGGPARFAITYGAQPQGRIVNSPVTLYAIAVRPTGNPPCTHTSLTPTPFPGPGNPACVAALGASWPLSVIGGPALLIGNTSPGGPPVPGIGFGKFGPGGTLSSFTFTPGGTMPGFSNIATSVGFPWTTGMLTISYPIPAPGFIFTITGMDNRTPGGAGSIRLVAGSLSNRSVSGPNANRGWVRLVLAPRDEQVPTMSPAGLAAMAGLMLLAGGCALRRSLSR